MTHEMHLQPKPFGQIKRGQKIWEIRFNDEKRQKVKAGDTIVFTNRDDGEKCEVTVTELVHAPSFDELFKKIDLTEAGWPAGTAPEQASADMRAYYDETDESRFGVVAISLRIL